VLDDLPFSRFKRGLVTVLVFASVTGLRRLFHAWLVGPKEGYDDMGGGTTDLYMRRGSRKLTMRAEVLWDQNVTYNRFSIQPAERSTKPPVRVQPVVQPCARRVIHNRDEYLCRCIGPGGSLLWVSESIRWAPANRLAVSRERKCLPRLYLT
jgi:hypothetical protein